MYYLKHRLVNDFSNFECVDRLISINFPTTHLPLDCKRGPSAVQ